jgi:hypothetical protein
LNLTVLIISITTLFLIAFDIYIIAKKGKQESISAHIIRGSKKYPLLVLCFGILLGHLFWSMSTEDIYYNTECITKDK